ncbi:MAG TPA: hydroxymethylglutaryl-CoA lyase [Ilumatobacteraceae bacterium]
MTGKATIVTIRDVTPRDGLQSESPVPASARAELAIALGKAGLAHVEAASFVSPTAVPAMAGGADVIDLLPLNGVTWWALVPNARGAEIALAAGVRNITVTISASAAYSEKNVGRSIAEALAGLRGIAALTEPANAVVDVVVSCAFGSPFGDVASPEPVVGVVDGALAAVPGCRITLADTTGTATPRRIAAVLGALPDAARPDLGLHLHDTRGTALANALWALEHGIVRFDTATGGLGGSPFAPGAGGNLATEDLVLVLHDLGVRTDIDLDAVIRISRSLPALVGHAVPSRTSAAGPLPSFDR